MRYRRVVVLFAFVTIALTWNSTTGLFALSFVNLAAALASTRILSEYKTEPDYCPQWAMTTAAMTLMVSLVFSVFGLIAA